MAAYRAVVVGTDGSESSLRAVERAAEVAGAAGATLYIATAYEPSDPPRSAGAAGDVLKGEAFQIVGTAPSYEILHKAGSRAKAAGAKDVQERAVSGNPVEALLDLVVSVKADLLVVGNRGLSSFTGRLLGSVPSDVARKADIDVLIVHTV